MFMARGTSRAKREVAITNSLVRGVALALLLAFYTLGQDQRRISICGQSQGSNPSSTALVKEARIKAEGSV